MVLQLGLLQPCQLILRPDWKGLPRANPLAYWALSSVTKEKSFITLTPDRSPKGASPSWVFSQINYFTKRSSLLYHNVNHDPEVFWNNEPRKKFLNKIVFPFFGDFLDSPPPAALTRSSGAYTINIFDIRSVCPWQGFSALSSNCNIFNSVEHFLVPHSESWGRIFSHVRPFYKWAESNLDP